VTTQHSLSSGRYSLLEPDFHRLDRTSLRLAHLFNHLVGMSDDTGCQIKVRCFGRSQVDDKFERGRLLDRYFGKRRRAKS
jgi:hypothetical protein